jgi:hypothetical protein
MTQILCKVWAQKSLSVKWLVMNETTGVHPTCSVGTAGFYVVVNEPQNNANHSALSTAKIKNVCNFMSTPPLYTFMT